MATSALNPNAPIFVPLAYRTVEDFSDQWWDLVHSSPWFRDYWLQECFRDPQNDPPLNDFFDSALPDIDFLFDDNITQNSSIVTNIQQEGGRMDLVSLGVLEWGKPRGTVEMTKYGEKAPKIVKVRVNPRPIKQPR